MSELTLTVEDGGVVEIEATTLVVVESDNFLELDPEGEISLQLSEAVTEIFVELSSDLVVDVPGLQGPSGGTGPQGPQGPSGVTTIVGGTVVRYSFAEASEVWLIQHDFQYHPDVDTYDQNDEIVYGDVSFPAPNVVRVAHGYPMTGFVRLR